MNYNPVLISSSKTDIEAALTSYCNGNTLNIFNGTTEAILYKVDIGGVPYLLLFNIWSYLPLERDPGTASVSGYILTINHRNKKGIVRVFHGTTVVLDPLLELSKMMSTDVSRVNYLNNIYQDLQSKLKENPIESAYSHIKFTEDLIAKIEK